MPRPKKEKPNRSDGLYEVKITTGKDIFTGKPIRQSFYSSISKEDARKKAEQWKIEQAVSQKTGDAFVTREITFEKWARRWLEIYKKPHVDENTYRYTYENTVEKHLIPYFSKAKVNEIRPIDIVSFFSTKTSMSESMLEKMKMCLNSIFLAAIDNDLCIKNPTRGVKYSTDKEKQEKQVYSDEKITAVETYAKERMPEVIILLETGLRRGELLGLRWCDVDLKNKSITVERSIADAKQGVKVRPPKWNSYRTNPLSDLAVSTFNELKSDAPGDAYIFPLSSGSPQSPNTWSQKLQRFMEAAAADIGAQKLTAHELRHTYGTKLRRDGVDIYTIQKVMGHKDIKMTSEIYVHNELDVLRKALVKGTDSEENKEQVS